jgi:hypothetical protein
MTSASVALSAPLRRSHVLAAFAIALAIAMTLSCSSALADTYTDVLTSLLQSASADKSLFAEQIATPNAMAQVSQVLSILHTQGGRLQTVDRQGGAYIAHFEKGDAPIQLTLSPQGRIFAFFVLSFLPKDQPLPKPLNDESAIRITLRRLFTDSSVDMALFADADVASKISNGRDGLVQNLGAFNGIYFSNGSYFARFDTMELPIFVYMTATKKIKAIFIYPPVPTKLIETGSTQ